MRKNLWIKIASLAVAILLVCVALVACDKNEAPSEDATKESTDNNTSAPIDVGTEQKDDTTEKPDTDSGTQAPEVTGGIVLFADEEYKCKVIRSEFASDVDSNVYNDVRAILKRVTDKNCSISTDFVGLGETLDTENPAVLVGRTEYPESKQIYDTLSHGEFKIELVGNKLVIAYTNEDSAALALTKLRALVASSWKNGSITMTEEWKRSGKLESSVGGLPVFEGSASMEFDAGDGSDLIVYKGVIKSTHDAFVAGIEELGYEHYVTNTIGENRFDTYHNEEKIMHVMYLPAIEQTRVVIDTKEFTELAGLESDNDYEPGFSEMSFTQLGLEHPEAGNCQNGMGYILKLSDGSFVIVDGGHTRDMSYAESAGDYLLDSLRVLADDPNDIRVHTWFISHIHNDHLGAFYDIARDTPDSIKVNRLIYNSPNDAQLSGVGGGSLDDKVENAAKMFGIEHIVKGHPGQVFYANEATFTIYGSLDIVEPIKIDNINETTMVMKMEFMGKTVMFLGDCHPNESLALTNIYGDSLRSNFIQLSHHGYSGSATLLLNETIKAEASFWPVGNYHYKNMVSKIGAVPENAPFVNIPHYVAGDTNLTIKDFDTWIPEEKRWTPYD